MVTIGQEPQRHLQGKGAEVIKEEPQRAVPSLRQQAQQQKGAGKIHREMRGAAEGEAIPLFPLLHRVSPLLLRSEAAGAAPFYRDSIASLRFSHFPEKK